MDSLEDVTDLIKRAIVEDPPLAQKDGGIIKEGYNEDVDKFRRSRTDGKKWLSELEAKERERTGIKTMKIKYNRVFGYSLEITILLKIWCRIIISVNRRLPMQSDTLPRS